MVEETCKNHHWGQICRISHAFEAFPSRLSNSPHTEGSQVPQHHYCHFPIITIWHRWWLCAGKVCPSAFSPRKPNRFGTLHLTDNSDNSSLLENSWGTVQAVSNISNIQPEHPSEIFFQKCLAQAVKGGQSNLTPNEQRHLIDHTLRVSTWTTTFRKWEEGA